MISVLKKSLVLSFFELKAKNHNTYLGFFWYFLEPFFMFIVLFYVRHISSGSPIENFIPYLFVGVIMIHFFISSTNLTMSGIVQNFDILNSRKIEPEIFVLSKFFMSLWNHLFHAFIVIIIMTSLGYVHSFLYIFVVPLYAVFLLGVGLILSVVSVKIFDIKYLWNYFCQILWFILPIFYLVNKDLFVVKYNPVYYFLELGRYLVFDLKSISFELILICFVISVLFLIIGGSIFYSQRKNISERIR